MSEKLVCEVNCFGGIKCSQRRTRPVKSLCWQFAPMQESTSKMEKNQ